MSKCHGDCKNFKVLSGKGGCERSKKSVDSMMSGCENWNENLSERHPVMKRGASFMGVVRQRSLLDVVLDCGKVESEKLPVPSKKITEADVPEAVQKVKEWSKMMAGIHPE